MRYGDKCQEMLESRPTWGERIEIAMLLDKVLIVHVPPPWGGWIEIVWPVQA